MPDDIRKPAVAGQFYPASPTELRRQIEASFKDGLGPGHLPEVIDSGPREIVGAVSPHAGYPFSGHTAAHAYDALAVDGRPDVAVVVGVNHGRGGLHSAVQTSGCWRTPLGDLMVAEDVAEKIAAALPDFKTNAEAFRAEHSLEVQLPFIQYVYEESLLFVPVMMAGQDIDAARAVGNAIAEALDGRDAVVIASTDMTHYESAATARKQDQVLIRRIEALDADGLISERANRQISMCGAGPVAATIIAAQRLGASDVESLAYTNSGDVMPSQDVVGYYAAVMRR
ncbi:MAG: AmmeMemoRadiSam system protein B [Armatimonadia bacterium]|nr:AmmeMemoRadiSam system protein B [Armatimonadia bacterium]